MNPKNAWPAVALAFGVMTMIGVMAALKVDREIILLAIMSAPTPVLAALLAAHASANTQATQALATQTNGNQTRMLEIMEGQGRLLAASAPLSEPPPDPLTSDPTRVP